MLGLYHAPSEIYKSGLCIYSLLFNSSLCHDDVLHSFLVNENILIYDNFWGVVGEGDNSVVQFCYNITICYVLPFEKKNI